MELQAGLREALKVELQCHQKLAVRSPNKPLPLIKAPANSGGQSIAMVSVVPANSNKALVSANSNKAPPTVAVHMNGQKAAVSSSSTATVELLLQTQSPVNLQGAVTASGATTNAILHPLNRRAVEMTHNNNSSNQMLGTLTAVPIKVPTVSSLHRLAGQAPTVLPQVRPKTHIPDSLPHSPGLHQEGGPLSLLQRGGAPTTTTILSNAKGLHQGASLPTANSTFSPEHPNNALTNGCLGDALPPAVIHIATPPPGAPPTQSQPDSAPMGVAYAIIAASPATAGSHDAVKVQPLLFSHDNKVIIIQGPQIQGSPGPQTVSPAPQDAGAPTPPPPPPAKKRDENPEKIAFMVALGLVTTEHLEEIQNKRQERKRRSTANPAYSGLFEPERKRLASNYLNNPLFLGARDSEDYCWKEDLEHDEHCSVCKEDGELQPCHNCPRAYHPNCLHPALKTPPRGAWYCPKCQKKVLNKENMSWPQNFVQSYVTHKTVRQEEKRRLLRRNSELKKECSHLEEEDNRLNKSLTHCMDLRDHLLGQQADTQASLDRLRSLIRTMQTDQEIQLTMTATTTSHHQLLSLPWIKPSPGGPSDTQGTPSSGPWIKPSPGPSSDPQNAAAGPSALLHKAQSSGNN